MEHTFVLIKPAGVKLGLTGAIVGYFDENSCKLVGLKVIRPPKIVFQKHYEKIAHESYYEELLQYMLSGQVVPMIFKGINAIEWGRRLVKSMGKDAMGRSLIHVAEDDRQATEDITLWFEDAPLLA